MTPHAPEFDWLCMTNGFICCRLNYIAFVWQYFVVCVSAAELVAFSFPFPPVWLLSRGMIFRTQE